MPTFTLRINGVDREVTAPAAYTSTASSAQDYALVHVLALKPAP